MRILIKAGLCLVLCFLQLQMYAQLNNTQVVQATQNGINNAFQMGLNMGYDKPSYKYNYPLIKYKGGLKFGAFTDLYFLGNFGLGIDYDFIKNSPESLVTDVQYPGGVPAPVTTTANGITRQFIGLGPNYRLPIGNSLMFEINTRFGLGLISGGDIISTTMEPLLGTENFHLIQTGFEDKPWTSKLKFKTTYFPTQNIGINLSAYYMRHYGCNADDEVDINSMGNIGLIYGQSDFDTAPGGEQLISGRPDQIIADAHCGDISSIGVSIGLSFRFGGSAKPKPEPQDIPCNNCGCPDDTHKVVVTVEDGPSGKKIPDADVAIVDNKGNIIATGTTNRFGVVDFGSIKHNEYTVQGDVFGSQTTTDHIAPEEFTPDAVIQKKLLYEDLRFILKGKVINKGTRAAEPNVVVSLTETKTKSVKQDNSDGKGVFGFQLDPNSSYEVVGIKENKLSDIDRASTVGLTRSTTLFVDLELGVDDFDCNHGTVLDIKYDYDKWDILPESRFELDRLVRYLQDHPSARVELSSHTDSRGSNDYNLSLSEKRANAAADYIASKGIARYNIIARGFGETQPLNHCKDGANCSESEHRINRRTEAKLICN